MNSKNILFLTWKDITHPNKGGAETIVYEYAKGLINKGHTVTWFGYAYKGCIENEIIDGITIIRKFNPYTSFFLFPKYYKNYFSGKYDIVIDEAGGLPFLSPLFEKNIPIILLTHHVGDKEWDYSFPFPFNIIGKGFYYALFKYYKDTKTITVSDSTKNDLINKFMFNGNNIKVIENTLNLKALDKIDFEKKENSILFIGRLMPIKRIEDAIKAFSVFNSKNPNYELNIVGIDQDKKYSERLIKLTRELLLSEKVNFVGYDFLILEKYLMISKVLLVPSYKEGFGLIVLEGNSYGLPAIGYNVGGLRDSIKIGINGYLVRDGEFYSMGNKLSEILIDENIYQALAIKSLDYVKNLESWKEKVDQFESFIFST